MVEMLVVLAIVGAISGVMAMTIGMVRSTTSDTTARNMTMSQVNQAASWIARDIESASGAVSTTTLNPAAASNPVMLCSMVRYVWQDPNWGTENITYVVNNIEKQLLRQVDGSAGTPIAQGIITSDNLTRVDRDGTNAYKIRLRSVYDGEYYQQQYKVSQRAP